MLYLPTKKTYFILLLALTLLHCANSDLDQTTDSSKPTVDQRADTQSDLKKDMSSLPDLAKDTTVHTVQDMTFGVQDMTGDAGEDMSNPTLNHPFDFLVPKGFPNSETTGLKTPIAQLTLHDGNFNTTQDGEIVENLIIKGYLNIKHKNVIVRNCRIYGGQFFGIIIRAENALIEDSEIGLDGQYAKLTKVVSPGDNKIEVDKAIPVGSYLLLSSMGKKRLRTLRVTDTSGNGPFRIGVERHFHKFENGQEIEKTESANIMFSHPAGATISFYDPATSPPLPGDGITSTAVLSKTIRRCNIHHVNDGFKMDNGVYEDNYVHEQIYIPKSHLDSVQSTRGVGAKLRHNSLVAPWDANGIQLAPDQGELRNLEMEYNYLSGGGFTLRWGVDGGRLRHNRFGRDSSFGPMTIYNGGRIDEVRDNRFADDGSVIPNGADSAFGDKNGDGSGRGDAWGSGYNPLYKLPGN